jgi:hypothetical protein
MMAGKSVMEKPRTNIQSTPTTNWDTMTTKRIRGMSFFGVLTSSARCVGQSNPMRVEKLLNSPKRTANAVVEYLKV